MSCPLDLQVSDFCPRVSNYIHIPVQHKGVGYHFPCLAAEPCFPAPRVLPFAWSKGSHPAALTLLGLAKPFSTHHLSGFQHPSPRSVLIISSSWEERVTVQ